jgi:hypothetical protein
MNIATKIFVFILVILFVTVIRQFFPPAIFIGAFAVYYLFFKKEDKPNSTDQTSSSNKSKKPTPQPKVEVTLNKVEPAEAKDTLIEKEPATEIITPSGNVFKFASAKEDDLVKSRTLSETTEQANLGTDMNSANSELTDEGSQVDKETVGGSLTKSNPYAAFKIERDFTLIQKIIFSLSAFAVFLVIAYAFAESLDYKMRIKKTWLVWIAFILLQAWLQNLLWSSKFRIAINFKIPSITPHVKKFWLKNKKTFYILIVVISVLAIGVLSINPVESYLKQKKLEKLAELKSLPSKSSSILNIKNAFASISFSNERMYLSLDVYVDTTIQISRYNLKNLYQFISDQNDQQISFNENSGNWVHSPRFKLESQDDFVIKYLEKEKLHQLYDSLYSKSYEVPATFGHFFSQVVNALPVYITIKFMDSNGLGITSISLSKSKMKEVSAPNGIISQYSFKEDIETTNVSSTDYEKITNWEISGNN